MTVHGGIHGQQQQALKVDSVSAMKHLKTQRQRKQHVLIEWNLFPCSGRL